MADDPVETAEEGTATETSEETAAESTEVVETEDSDSIPADDAEGDDSEGVSAKSDVKYSRFRSVNERRKAAELENIQLKARLSALEPKPIEVKPPTTRDRLKKTLTPAPADMTALEQMEYYALGTLEQHPEILDEWFEKKFGMKPDAAAATLSHATVSTREQIISQFNEAAASHGLDPKNENLRSAVGALMDTGKFRSFGEAMDAFKPANPIQKTVAKTINGKGQEVESLDLTGLSRVRAMPRNAQDAMKLAAAGKRIEAVSVTDILRATQDKH